MCIRQHNALKYSSGCLTRVAAYHCRNGGASQQHLCCDYIHAHFDYDVLGTRACVRLFTFSAFPSIESFDAETFTANFLCRIFAKFCHFLKYWKVLCDFDKSNFGAVSIIMIFLIFLIANSQIKLDFRAVFLEGS